VATTGKSQILASAPTPKEIPLLQILKELKHQKPVSFLYEPENIENVLIQTPFNYKEDTKRILKTILSPVGLKFRKVGKYNFIIKRAKNWRKKGHPRINQKPGQSFLKQKTKTLAVQTISGIVYSREDGQTLMGSTVQIKNTAIGTTTDEFGEYSLKIPPGRQTLVFSYLGFKDKQVQINGQPEQNVILEVASTRLDEVIITAVGIEANKRLLGYAADNLSPEDFSLSNAPNLVSALSGQSAGVWVNTASGSPGASASIFIRGMRSVNGSNKPLFILDGIPIDNTTTGNGTQGVDVSNRLIDLNRHDIAKISILKGPAATALYGIRAANGAIVMASKKGKQGKPKVQFSSSFGFQKVNKLPPRQTTYSQGKHIDGRAVYQGPETNVSTSYGPPVSELEFDGDNSYPYDQNGRLVPKGQGNGVLAKVYDPYAAFFVQGHSFDNHLAISGGTNWFNYYLSFGQLLQTGVVPNSTFERYTLKGIFDVRLAEKFRMGVSTTVINSGGFRMKRGSQFSGVPLGLFRNPNTFDIGNGKTGKAAANTPASYIFENGKQRAYRGNGRYDNPFWSVNRNPFEDKVNRLIQNVSLDYQLNSWLKATYKIGFDLYTDSRKDAFDINSGTHRNGQVDLSDIQSININSDFLLTAEKKLSGNWHLKASLGHNFFTSEFSIRETKGDDLKKQGVYNISNAIHLSTNETLLRKKVAGVFADVMFQYKNILYLNLTGRNDWSSTLPKKNNAFFYPSLNLGFEFTELLGWTDSPLLSYGKLRFSYSRVGNDAGAYLTDTYFNFAVAGGDALLPNTDFPAFGVSAFERSGTLGNPNLKPETVTSYEIGTDLKFFRGRMEFDFTWYQSTSQDQIINTQLPATTGFLLAPRNAGTIENRGVEIGLSTSLLRKSHFRWDLAANFSHFESLVKKLPEGSPSIVLASFTNLSSMIIEGQPYGVLVGTSIKRDAQGSMIIDSYGFPAVNAEQTVVGDPNPDWLLGLRNTFTYKNFSLSALLDIRRGGDLWNGTRGVMSYLGISKISGDQREVRNFIFPGITETGEPNTQAVDLANPANGPSGIYWQRYGFLGLAEQHIEDASWIRLRELKFSYRFHPPWSLRHPPEFSVSLSGQNVFLITNYSGIDPETNLRGDSNILGWDYFNLPNTKGWSLSLDVQF